MDKEFITHDGFKITILEEDPYEAEFVSSDGEYYFETEYGVKLIGDYDENEDDKEPLKDDIEGLENVTLFNGDVIRHAYTGDVLTVEGCSHFNDAVTATTSGGIMVRMEREKLSLYVLEKREINENYIKEVIEPVYDL